MPLDVLSRFDRETSNNILAATALSTTSNAGLDDTSDLIKKYQSQVDAVLSEIRQKLRLGKDDRSPKATAAIDNYLVKALDDSVLLEGEATIALRRAAQAGRLSPAAYKVIQPEPFRKRFYPLAVTKNKVEEAVKQPDDFQHLMADRTTVGEEDIFSIFLKRSMRSGYEQNWFLVQSLRRELDQIAQSAWRVYPSEVDLSKAEKPIDVLKAFVDRFGIEVKVGSRTAKFIDVTSFPKSGEQMKYAVEVPNLAAHPDYFLSMSHRTTIDVATFDIGLVYCIDMAVYRKSLIAHGASVH
jgi:hypothetical protein